MTQAHGDWPVRLSDRRRFVFLNALLLIIDVEVTIEESGKRRHSADL